MRPLAPGTKGTYNARLQADDFTQSPPPRPGDDHAVVSRKDDRGSCSQASSPDLSTVVRPIDGEGRAAPQFWRQIDLSRREGATTWTSKPRFRPPPPDLGGCARTPPADGAAEESRRPQLH
jgi:hypothetical protein